MPTPDTACLTLSPPAPIDRPKASRRQPSGAQLVQAGVLFAFLVELTGCQVGRQWFRMDSDSRSPTMGIELRGEQPPPKPEQPIADAGTASSRVETTSLPQPAGERPRRLLPDWLKLGKGEDPVPLPITQSADPAAPVASAGGPVEEFQ